MRTVIFANGELNHPRMAREMVLPGDYLIAADGGLRHMRTLGLSPHLVIGDMDSIDPTELDRLKQNGVLVLQFPAHKDQTDLELALNEALARGGNPIFVMGALGGRLDLTIANIMLMMNPDLRQVDVRIVDGLQELYFIHGHAIVEGTPGERVSLLAFDGPVTGIRTFGLAYPLQDEVLYPQQARGVSNVLQGERAEIWVRQGHLLCIHSRGDE